ncbi:MAG TPA: DUF6580 family putative transport protein [Acidobacteriaceae bacterium]|nr:DUF6580 family putative transport protein [Acidobacteriaceae bacterium]
MLAYAVLLLAVLSRILPPAFHATAWNFTAVGGSLLFFGSRMGGVGHSRWDRGAFGKLASAVAVLAATDYYLTVFAYHFPFHVSGYVATWIWYAAICLLGMGLLGKPSALGVVVGVLATSTSFFLLSNFMVWAGGTMYPHTGAGLAECFTLGIPFYRNDLVSTAITAAALFGLPVLAAKIAESMEAARHNQPLA